MRQPTRGAHWHLSSRYHGNLALVRKKLNVNDTQGTGTPSGEPAISLRAATAEPFPSEALLPICQAVLPVTASPPDISWPREMVSLAKSCWQGEEPD